MNIRAKVALDKQKYPDRFCPVVGCLWKVRVHDWTNIHDDTLVQAPGCHGGFCPRHQHLRTKEVPHA